MGKNDTWLDGCLTNSDDWRCRVIFYCKAVSAISSLIGCLLALGLIIIYRKYRFFTQRLVMYLLMPSILVACLSLNPDISHSTECQIVGFIFNIGVLSQRLLICCIVVHLLLLTMSQNRFRYLEIIFHVVVWVVSIIISCVPWFSGIHYGPAGVWCWIQNTSSYESGLRLGCFYIWLIIGVALEIVVYFYIWFWLHKKLRTYEGNDPRVIAKRNQYKKNMKPLLWYPLLDLVLTIPVSVNRAQNWIAPDNPIFPLFLIHSIVYPSWGLWNALLYLINKETLMEMKPRNIYAAIARMSNVTVEVTGDSKVVKNRVVMSMDNVKHDAPTRSYFGSTSDMKSDE